SQPESPSGSKPSAQAEAGIPAGTQAPSVSSSPGAQPPASGAPVSGTPASWPLAGDGSSEEQPVPRIIATPSWSVARREAIEAVYQEPLERSVAREAVDPAVEVQ